MLGRGEVALGLGAESCAAACIPADGGTLKIGTLYRPAVAAPMSMIPAVAGVSEPVRLAIPEAEKDIISITKNISCLLLCFPKTHEF